MTPEEYRSALEALGLTQVGGSDVLGVDERTSRRWALGERQIPISVARLLRLMIRKRISPEYVRNL